MENKITKKVGPNPDQVEFIFPGRGLDIDIPKYYISKGVQVERTPEVSARMKNLILDTLSIPGIESFCIQSKYISIRKGKAFDWDWVEPVLRELFEKYELGDASLLLNSKPCLKLRVITDKVEENGRRKTYHTTALISEARDEYFEHWLWNHNKAREEEYSPIISSPIHRIGKHGVNILDQIFKGNEINQICIKPYALKIEKKRNVEWDSIDKTVFDAITNNASRLVGF